MLNFNLVEFIKAAGYLGLFGIVFAETGLLVGFFLPGDSLLFTAGILAAQGYLNIALLLFLLVAAAIIGDSSGYKIGKTFGPKLFNKDESILFKKSHVDRAQKFFDRHGPKTIIIAKFVPIVRTFVPTMAGVGQMKYSKFISYSVVGVILWIGSVTMLGYYLGLTVPNIEKYIIPGIVIIILISISPYLKQLLFNREVRAQTFDFVTKGLKKVFPRKP
ncbi:MAG TPA: VTT domain-containing protein [Patescibacteria group bacterium]|jgi:membrane-associated protein|nr:VTT domain-containing protein [Patescibacteria group bacterium]